MTYESDLARLEEIVAELERDDVSLDRALALFQEGVARLRTAATAIEVVEREVKVLRERADGTFDLGTLGE